MIPPEAPQADRNEACADEEMIRLGHEAADGAEERDGMAVLHSSDLRALLDLAERAKAAEERVAKDGSLIFRLSDTIDECDARIAELTEALNTAEGEAHLARQAEADARTDAEWHKARNAVLEADSALVPELVEALDIFLNGDSRFQVQVGGNPIAIDKLVASLNGLLERAKAVRGC